MLIERLRTMCADIRRKPIALGHLIPLMQESATEIERLRAEVEALRADNKHLRGAFEKVWPDAERYRWLRKYAGRGAAGSIFDNFSGTAVDECIDAARAAREKK